MDTKIATLREKLEETLDWGMPAGLSESGMDEWSLAADFARCVLSDPKAKTSLFREALAGLWHPDVSRTPLCESPERGDTPASIGNRPLTLIQDTQFRWVAHSRDVSQWWNQAESYEDFCNKVSMVEHPLNQR